MWRPPASRRGSSSLVHPAAGVVLNGQPVAIAHPMPEVAAIAERLPHTLRCLRAGLGSLHPGAQLYVSLRGEVIADAGLGEAAPGQPLTADHAMRWLSAGKPLTAVAVLQQIEAGRIGLDDPVARFLPEFAAHGKSGVTIAQLLTHTAGIQPVPTGWPRESWEAILDRICRAKLRHGATPGAVAAYDPQRSWFVLGEILQRVEGRPFEEVLQATICEPLGLSRSSWTAAPRIAPAAVLHVCDGSRCAPQPESAAEDACPAPGSSFAAPARELGRFYEMLLNRGTWCDRRLLTPASVDQLTTRHRRGQFDLTFQHVVDFGLGVLIDSNQYGVETVPYGFGRHCSARTFGHGGSECAIAFADPEYDLVVAVAVNGRPGEAAHQQRHREICSAIYRDLGLAD